MTQPLEQRPIISKCTRFFQCASLSPTKFWWWSKPASSSDLAAFHFSEIMEVGSGLNLSCDFLHWRIKGIGWSNNNSLNNSLLSIYSKNRNDGRQWALLQIPCQNKHLLVVLLRVARRTIWHRPAWQWYLHKKKEGLQFFATWQRSFCTLYPIINPTTTPTRPLNEQQDVFTKLLYHSNDNCSISASTWFGLVDLLRCGWAFCPSHFALTFKWGLPGNDKLNKH